MEIEKLFNICPVCGLPSDGTSVVCSKHISITYNSSGRVVEFKDGNVPISYPSNWRAFIPAKELNK